MLAYVILTIICNGPVCAQMQIGPTFSDKAQCEKVAKRLKGKCDWWLK